MRPCWAHLLDFNWWRHFRIKTFFYTFLIISTSETCYTCKYLRLLQPAGLFSLQLLPVQACIILFFFSFPALPFSTYSIWFLLTQYLNDTFLLWILYCPHSETLPLLITAAFLLIDQLPAAHANRDTNGLHPPHLLKTGFPHATPCLILTTSVAVSGHDPIIFCRNWEGASEEKRCTPCVICDEKLRATSYHFRRKSVTLRHRLSLPEKPLNDSTDLLFLWSRGKYDPTLPPPSNTQLVNNQSNVHLQGGKPSSIHS